MKKFKFLLVFSLGFSIYWRNFSNFNFIILQKIHFIYLRLLKSTLKHSTLLLHLKYKLQKQYTSLLSNQITREAPKNKHWKYVLETTKKTLISNKNKTLIFKSATYKFGKQWYNTPYYSTSPDLSINEDTIHHLTSSHIGTICSFISSKQRQSNHYQTLAMTSTIDNKP